MSNGQYYDEELHDEPMIGFHEVDEDDDFLDDDEDHVVGKKKPIDDDEEDLDVLLKDFDLPEEDPDEFNADIY